MEETEPVEYRHSLFAFKTLHSFNPNINWPLTHKLLYIYKHPAKYGHSMPSPCGLKQEVSDVKGRNPYHKHRVQFPSFGLNFSGQ